MAQTGKYFLPGAVAALILGGLVLSIPADAASGASGGLTPDVRCQPPKVGVKTTFSREKITYDIERQNGYAQAGKPLGWYRVRDSIGYQGKLAKGCVAELAVRIEVQPEIALRSRYKNKSGKCAGKIVLAHERRHGAVAKTEYGKLAALIKKEIRKLFGGFRVENFGAASTAINAKLDGGIYSRFLKSYNIAQGRFHNKLKNARIIKKEVQVDEPEEVLEKSQGLGFSIRWRHHHRARRHQSARRVPIWRRGWKGRI